MSSTSSEEKHFHPQLKCKIIADSSCDFAPEVVKSLGIQVLPFHYVGPDGEHLDDGWQSQSPHDFYEFMRKNPEAHFSTTAISPGEYYEAFSAAVADGSPVLFFSLPAALSSSITAARQAADMVRQDHPDAEIYIIDNQSASSASELLLMEVVHQAAKGLSAKELVKWAEEARYFVHGYFTVDSFHWLALGGRIPPSAAQLGTKLDVKPELSYDTMGALTVRGMCRGRKKALRAILQDFRDNYAHDSSLPLSIISADAEKDADWLEAQIRKEKNCEGLNILRSSVGPVLGCHVGPGMVAVVFWGTDRRNRRSLTDRIARRVKRSTAHDE